MKTNKQTKRKEVVSRLYVNICNKGISNLSDDLRKNNSIFQHIRIPLYTIDIIAKQK